MGPKRTRIEMAFLAAALVLCLIVAGGAAVLADEGRPCDSDIETLCAEVGMGGGDINQCLEHRMEKLTPACRESIEALVDQTGEVVRQGCEEDIRYFCFGIEPGRGRIAQCLKANRANLSELCRMTIIEAGRGFQ
ncbi:MAG: cysteine rich repeat-containing protein [Syntrophorhabdales bacterium]|jgi:hypothetical protein